jgi:hypothetical protein
MAPAQNAAGTAWIAPQLIQLLDDPYDAVRYSAPGAQTCLASRT